jgi:hypothetical protein
MQAVSPTVAIVLLRYVLSKQAYPFLFVAVYSAPAFLMAVGYLLFISYRPRSRWPKLCGLASQSRVPRYLLPGDMLLLQLPYCAAHLLTVLAISQPNMTAMRAVVVSKADIIFASVFAVLPPSKCCVGRGRVAASEAPSNTVQESRGGGRGFCAGGRLPVLLGMLLSAASIGAFLFLRWPSGGSLAMASFGDEPMLGYAYLGGARLCDVARVALARFRIRRNAARYRRVIAGAATHGASPCLRLEHPGPRYHGESLPWPPVGSRPRLKPTRAQLRRLARSSSRRSRRRCAPGAARGG